MDDNTIVEGPLYTSQTKIYPQSVRGRFRTIKWTLSFLALSIYYLLPFVRWDRGPYLPDQAVLIDIPHRRFYFFFIELWPQEVYYFTGLLIIAAMTLFFMNALAGRIWCGYLCWQTVWTDLFYAVERWIEGDRRERMLKDKKGWTLAHLSEEALKHFLWLVIAMCTGGAWVLYFADAPTLARELVTFQAPFVAYCSVGVLTFFTYVCAGHMREQVCIYMCPWPRIQAALTDEWALNVEYRADRGEPRISAKKAARLRAQGKPAGDCVDCHQCVAVCPAGGDIRRGSQLFCIQCGLCIDACDKVMKEIGREPGLIAYDNDINIERRRQGLPPIYRPLRARTILYPAIIAVVGLIMVYALATRPMLGVDVLHDRNPLATMTSDGGVRNAYTVRLLNKRPEARKYALSIEGLPKAQVEIMGEQKGADVEVGPDQTLELRVIVFAPPGAVPAKARDVVFRIKDAKNGDAATAEDHFFPETPSP